MDWIFDVMESLVDFTLRNKTADFIAKVVGVLWYGFLIIGGLYLLLLGASQIK